MKKLQLLLVAMCCALMGTAQLVNLTFDDATAISGWAGVADATGPEAVIAYDAAGNGTGALSVSATNPDDGIGKAYIFQTTITGLDFSGSTDYTLTFDAKSASLTGAAVHLQTILPGAGAVNNFDIQTGGLNDAGWTPYSFSFSGVDNSSDALTIHFNLAAGAFNGAGGTLIVDNIVLTGTGGGGGGTNGCTDPAASNYDSSAGTDDGSCLYAVTLNVDMSCEDPASFTTPAVESPAFGWCGGCAPMSDNGDGTWTVVLDLPLGNFEYKYAVDNFAGQENLVDDMQNGASCAPITDFASYANREIAVAAGAVFNDTYGSCSACVVGSGCTDNDAVNYDASASSDDGSCQYNVTFTVDMNNYGTPGVDFTTPEVNGGFNGWCGGCNPLSDPEGDNIWTTTIPLPIGSYDYQFAVDSWTDQEFGLDPAAPCTNGGNRFVDVVDSPVDQGEVCWELCVACTSGAGCTDSDATNYDSAATSDDGSCTYEVIFTVDMNQYGTAGVDYTTPEVNGSFNGWCGGCAPMSDPEADGVWTTTIVLGAGTWEYQFAVDSWTD
ncbi:MAG: hypothetical protein ACON34_00920, partial [Flavobacteriales bacterium]